MPFEIGSLTFVCVSVCVEEECKNKWKYFRDKYIRERRAKRIKKKKWSGGWQKDEMAVHGNHVFHGTPGAREGHNFQHGP